MLDGSLACFTCCCHTKLVITHPIEDAIESLSICLTTLIAHFIPFLFEFEFTSRSTNPFTFNGSSQLNSTKFHTCSLCIFKRNLIHASSGDSWFSWKECWLFMDNLILCGSMIQGLSNLRIQSHKYTNNFLGMPHITPSKEFLNVKFMRSKNSKFNSLTMKKILLNGFLNILKVYDPLP